MYQNASHTVTDVYFAKFWFQFLYVCKLHVIENIYGNSSLNVCKIIKLKSAFQFYFTESETLYWHHIWKQLQMLTEGYYQVFEQSRNVHLGHNISNYNRCFVKRPCLFSMINCLKLGYTPTPIFLWIHLLEPLFIYQ